MDMLAFDKMKGNRRKQSKPIRVSNSADSETVEPGSNFIGQSDFQNNGEISDENNFHSKTKNIYLHTKSNLMVTMKYIAYKPPYTTLYKNILNNMKKKFKQWRFTKC
jgi:hypothetical protein